MSYLTKLFRVTEGILVSRVIVAFHPVGCLITLARGLFLRFHHILTVRIVFDT